MFLKGKRAFEGNAAMRLRSLFTVILLIALAFAVYWSYTRIINPPLSAALADGEAAVRFIDVGQGDSVLIQTTQGCVLIDGGDMDMGGRVVGYLRDAGIVDITYVIATHPHSDHIGGLIAVLGEFPVGALIMPNVAHTSVTFERFLDVIEQRGIPLREPVIGDTFSVGKAEFTVIAPNSDNYQSLNDYSVSLRMVLGATSFIFTGDAETTSESEMTRHYLSSDVLFVGHHGSSTSTTQVFLDAVSPSIAVISVGSKNSYNHPNDGVLKRLQDAGVKVYRTDRNGNITIITDGSSLSVSTERAS